MFEINTKLVLFSTNNDFKKILPQLEEHQGSTPSWWGQWQIHEIFHWDLSYFCREWEPKQCHDIFRQSVVETWQSFDSYFFNILAESSLGSMTSTAHPIDSSAFKFSNNSSLFSSFKVFESALRRMQNFYRENIFWFKKIMTITGRHAVNSSLPFINVNFEWRHSVERLVGCCCLHHKKIHYSLFSCSLFFFLFLNDARCLNKAY